jgi:acetylornithine deacetylase/succinyl-diaminopimelate desuccinylase family protein
LYKISLVDLFPFIFYDNDRFTNSRSSTRKREAKLRLSAPEDIIFSSSQTPSSFNQKINKVCQRIDQLESESLELLFSLIRFNTADPPAGNCGPAQSWLADYLKTKVSGSIGIDMFYDFPSDPHLVATLDSKSRNGRSIIFNGHIDVAEVRKDEAWTFGPFNPVLKGGLVFGRGSADMKAGLVSMITAVRAVKDCGLELGGEVIFESVCGEEAGEAGTKTCIEKGYKADFAVVAEPTNFRIQGQGGVITGWLVIKSNQTFHDGMRRMMIHAGGGVEGASAIEKMIKLIGSLQELERHWAVMKAHPKMPPGSTTINPSVIHGGRNPAFVADECRLWLTVHMLPGETYLDITREVEEYIGNIAKADPWLRKNPPQFIWGGKSMFRGTGEIFPAVDINEDNPAIKSLAMAHKSVLGSGCEFSIMPSVTDAGWFANAGIPCAIYGPGDLSQAHAIDEYVSCEDIQKASKVFATLLLLWCGWS